MKRIWTHLPLWIRLLIIGLVLGMSIRPPFATLTMWLCWSGLVLGLLVVGAIRLRLIPVVYLVMTFVSMGWVLLTLLAFKKPVSLASGFWGHYPEFMMYLLAGYLVISAVRLEEWVSVIRKIPRVGVAFAAIVIAFPTAIASALSSIRRAVEARSLSRPRLWYAPGLNEGLIIRQLDNFEVRTTVYVETARQLVSLIGNWRQTVTMATARSKKYDVVNLNDIYEIDSFPLIYEAIFDKRPVTQEWQHLIETYVTTGKRVLDIGAGPGKLSMLLASMGADVYAIESNQVFVDILSRRATETFGPDHISIYHGRFPNNRASSKCDVAVLHQNVMLELINEMGTTAAMDALRRATTDEGVILFDYPARITIPGVGDQITLLDIRLPGFGHVNYSYVYEGNSNGYHQATISLTTTVADKMSTHSVNMKGIAPPVSEILAAAENVGLTLEKSSPTEAYTFFPSEMYVYALRPLHGD